MSAAFGASPEKKLPLDEFESIARRRAACSAGLGRLRAPLHAEVARERDVKLRRTDFGILLVSHMRLTNERSTLSAC